MVHTSGLTLGLHALTSDSMSNEGGDVIIRSNIRFKCQTWHQPNIRHDVRHYQDHNIGPYTRRYASLTRLLTVNYKYFVVQILYASRIPTSLLGIDAKMYVNICYKSLRNLPKSWKIHPKSFQNPSKIYEKSMKTLFWTVWGQRSPLQGGARRPRWVPVDLPHGFWYIF